MLGLEGWRWSLPTSRSVPSLIIILALGESIVTLGVHRRLDLAPRCSARPSSASRSPPPYGGRTSTSSRWYSEGSRRRRRAASGTASPATRTRTCISRWSREIIFSAFGLHGVLAHVDEPLHGSYPYALLGGVSLYLLAHVALRGRTRTRWTDNG